MRTVTRSFRVSVNSDVVRSDGHPRRIRVTPSCRRMAESDHADLHDWPVHGHPDAVRKKGTAPMYFLIRRLIRYLRRLWRKRPDRLRGARWR